MGEPLVSGESPPAEAQYSAGSCVELGHDNEGVVAHGTRPCCDTVSNLTQRLGHYTRVLGWRRQGIKMTSRGGVPAWVLVTLLASVGLVMATSAEAQTREWAGNGFVRVNGAHQSGNRSFQERLSFLLYDEVADYTIQHTSTSGVVFEIGGGLRMWRSIAAAISFTSFQTRSTLDVSGSVPHPLFFERPRTARLQRTDLSCHQLGMHFQAVYVIPITETIVVSVFGGPSVFHVKQDSVTSVVSEEVEPFDSVTVKALTRSTAGTSLGANGGGDVSYMFTEWVGASVFVRYASTSVDLSTASGTASVDGSGLQFGGGLRYGF